MVSTFIIGFAFVLVAHRALGDFEFERPKYLAIAGFGSIVILATCASSAARRRRLRNALTVAAVLLSCGVAWGARDRRPCDDGEASDCVNVASDYVDGADGLPMDDANARSLFARYCRSAPRDCFDLAMSYGNGDPRDQAIAVALLVDVCGSSSLDCEAAARFDAGGPHWAMAGEGSEVFDDTLPLSVWQQVCRLGDAASCRGLASAAPAENSVPSWEGKVEVTDFSSTAPLASSGAFIARLRRGFRSCGRAAGSVDPTVSGRETLTVTIAPDGEVTSAAPSGKSGLPEEYSYRVGEHSVEQRDARLYAHHLLMRRLANVVKRATPGPPGGGKGATLSVGVLLIPPER